MTVYRSVPAAASQQAQAVACKMAARIRHALLAAHGGRAGKLRLDFNENTVGCSPRVIESIRQGVDADRPRRLSRIWRGQSRRRALSST